TGSRAGSSFARGRIVPTEPVVNNVQSVNGLFKALGAEPGRLARSRPFYRRLAELVQQGIAQGDVPGGAQLPPERDLARALRVSRTTVVSAYRELESRGL